MNRLEIFKRKRRNRQFIVSAIIISIIVLLIGIATVDYTFNNMLNAQKELKIITLSKQEDSIYLLNVMNCTGKINLSYIKRDLDSVYSWFNNSYSNVKTYFAKVSDYTTRRVTNMK